MRLSRVNIYPQRDLVCELLGLQIGMMREDPHVSELVRDNGAELVVAQCVDERAFKRDLIRAAMFDGRPHRHHQRIRRDEGGDDVAAQRQATAEVVDHVLNALSLRVRFSGFRFSAARSRRSKRQECSDSSERESRCARAGSASFASTVA